MREAKIERFTAGFGLSAAASILLNALILVVKETNEHVMNFFKSLMGHHWVTHGAIVIGMFIMLGFIFSATNLPDRLDAGRILKYLIWAVIIGGSIIAGFFAPNLRAAL
ncbi:MAG: hypothetical protein H6Q52_1610 [Deltaproteobacteria bacterium]|nr:hypothetical protein [Deltaproteobacteria bacterium]